LDDSIVVDDIQAPVEEAFLVEGDRAERALVHGLSDEYDALVFVETISTVRVYSAVPRGTEKVHIEVSDELCMTHFVHELAFVAEGDVVLE
jgi:hypothetical protein